MKCSKCQFSNPDEAKFCIECGNPLEFHCPKCGSATPGTGKYCMECGFDLQRPLEPPHIDYSEPQSYTPKFLQDKILTDRSTLEGERKLVTVLFADVANYTSMSENLDPEEVHQIMDGCFKILMDEIHRYEGTINQFTGDGVMALFGAPVAHEDHAQRACQAALSIQNAIRKYSEKVNKDCGADFQMRIGINSGPVIVGSIGDDLRMDYTAIGDTTNLASRMESLAQPGTICLSGITQRLTRDFFEFNSLGKVEIKGKEDPQEAFELIKTGEVQTRIGASVAKGLTRFVGRKNSMAALMEAFDKVKSGSGQVVGVVGEAGVGKSRLLLEMRNMLPQGEFSYLEGRCIHFGGSMIYLPILDILRSYFEIKDGDREFIIKKKIQEKIIDLDEKLKGILSPIHELLSLKGDDEAFIKLEANAKREKTFEAIRDLLIRICQDKPLILVVEDLHWIDKTSEEFFGYLIDWLATAPILLILLYRPEYTHQWGSKSYYTKVGVDQLGTPSSTELVRAILEEGKVAPELEQLILNRAAGNPLFMEEFTHTLLENGSIERKSNQYVLSRNAADIQVPDTIQGIIAARMDRLEDNLKRTMQVASVIGRDFAFRILQTITGMREELKAYLLNLQGLEFIYEKRLFPELEYIFKHALTQEVAYNSLLLKRRKEIHENIGKAIEEIYYERLEEFYEMLAYHYSKCENKEKAYEYLKRSGNKAARNHSIVEAFQFYKEAIQILNQLPEIPENRKERLEVFHLMTTPISLLGFSEENLRFLLEGEKLARELNDNKGIIIFSGIIGIFYTYQGKSNQGKKYAKNAFEEARKLNDLELMARAVVNLCVSSLPGGEFTETMNSASKVIRLIEKEKAEGEIIERGFNVYSLLCAFLGRFTYLQGNFQKGKILIEKGLQKAYEISEPRALGNVELQYGWYFIDKGDWELAIKHLKTATKYLEEVKAVIPLSLALSSLGYAFSFVGDFESSCNFTENGLKIQIEAGSNFFLSMQYWVAGVVHFAKGDQGKALGFAEKASVLSQRFDEKWFEGISSIWLGRILAKTDASQKEKAENSILIGIQILEKMQIKPYYSQGHLALGELYADAGQAEKALKNLKRAEGLFEEMGMDYWLARTRELIARL